MSMSVVTKPTVILDSARSNRSCRPGVVVRWGDLLYTSRNAFLMLFSNAAALVIDAWKLLLSFMHEIPLL